MVVPTYLACSRDHPLCFDSRVVREWYGQLAEAAHTPGLAQHLVRHMGVLLPRFAAYYERLKSLPRRVRRALARCRGLSLAGVALLLALCGGPLHAATISVDEATCRFADAITAANTDSATGGCPAGSGEDVIVLDADVILGAALPSILSDLTIEAGLGAIIDGSGNACLVVETGNVTLDGLTVRNCVAGFGGGVYNRDTLAIANCTISGNSASGYGCSSGGGVFNYGGTLTIANCTISGNSATSLYGCSSGGGVFNYGGTLTITDSAISGNTASFGGAFSGYTGKATLTNSVISGNTASREGGGLSTGSYYFGTTLDIRTSTISGNTAASGGGIATYQRAVLLVTQSTLSGNTATLYGGAVHTFLGYVGPDLTFTNSTISGNAAGQEGGGIFGEGGYSTTITLEHALVSGNTAPRGPEMSLEPFLYVNADNFNVIGYDGDDRSEGFTPGATDIVPAAGVLIDDILAPLADNGGPTYTHAVVPGSPAVDAIPASDPNCEGTTDQRGFPRPVGVGCDIGSFELGSRLPFGGSVTGFTPRQITCQDRTTGQRLRAKPGDTDWDCEALGLSVQPGDEVQTSGRGVAEASEVPVGGVVTGMTPRAVFCQNLTTGMKAQTPTSAAEWDCEAMGLVIEPGDRVVTGALGTVDSPPAAERP